MAVLLAATRPSYGPHPFNLTEDVNVRSYSLALRLAEGGKLAAVEDAVIDMQVDSTGRHQAAAAAQGIVGDDQRQGLAAA